MSEEKKWIKRFIEFAKFWGLPVEEDFKSFLVCYDGYWTRYEVKDYVAHCLVEEDRQIDILPKCARHCWKLMIFKKKREDVDKTVDFLLPLLKKGEIKSFKHNGEGLIKNKPRYVIIIYTWGVKERDNLKAKLRSLGFTNIQCRKGCEAFEKKFGHWKTWFKDEPE